MEKIKQTINGEEYWGEFHRAHACLGCGCREVFVWDCGYTTFNPGGVACVNCHSLIKIEFFVSIKEALKKWNEVNPLAEVRVKEIESRIEELRKEQERIKELFKLRGRK